MNARSPCQPRRVLGPGKGGTAQDRSPVIGRLERHLAMIDTLVIFPATSGITPVPIAPPAERVVVPPDGSTSGKNTSCPVSPGDQVSFLLACVGWWVAARETAPGVPFT